MNQIKTSLSSGAIKAATELHEECYGSAAAILPFLRELEIKSMAEKIEANTGCNEMFDALEHVRGYLTTCKHGCPDWIMAVVENALNHANEVSPAT